MKPKRRYRKIDDTVIARFIATRAIEGNGTRAVELLEPDSADAKSRARDIAIKSHEVSGLVYVDKRINEIAEVAIDRVGELVHSADEQVATRNAHFVIDQARGKAIQRNENKNINLNIESILD